MVLEVVKFGHPVLRQKGSRIQSLDSEVRQLIADMLETMYAAKGVGLAAQQVGHTIQLTVVDVTGVNDRPSTMEVEGQKVEISAHMPLVLVNPEVKPVGDSVTGPEGCLSFPEIYGDITRPECVEVKALNDKVQPISFRAGGLLAKAIQHEVDHLNGILFIDRMDRKTKDEIRPEIDALQAETKARLAAARKKK